MEWPRGCCGSPGDLRCLPARPSVKEQDPAPREPVIGWITFLAASRKVPKTAAPPGVAVEDVAGGTLLRIGEDPRAVDVGIVMRLRKALALSGSLAPAP